jgi:hypothetical protein
VTRHHIIPRLALAHPSLTLLRPSDSIVRVVVNFIEVTPVRIVARLGRKLDILCRNTSTSLSTTADIHSITISSGKYGHHTFRYAGEAEASPQSASNLTTPRSRKSINKSIIMYDISQPQIDLLHLHPPPLPQTPRILPQRRNPILRNIARAHPLRPKRLQEQLRQTHQRPL